jgi:hypothetical protein
MMQLKNAKTDWQRRRAMLTAHKEWLKQKLSEVEAEIKQIDNIHLKDEGGK